MYKLVCKTKISKKQATEKIKVHALYGNHTQDRPKDGKQLELFFLQNHIDINKLIEECRLPNSQIPYFENLIGPVWTVTGGQASWIDGHGETVAEVNGPGVLVTSNYWAHFDAACKARDRAIDEISTSSLQEALSQGFASIEAFLNTEASNWNKKNSDNPLSDSASNKVSLETKLDEWVKIIAQGKSINKLEKSWSDFKKLKKLRDNYAIHPKHAAHGLSYNELSSHINDFRTGIALFLGNLHLLFGRAVPSTIINAVYHPDVEVKEF